MSNKCIGFRETENKCKNFTSFYLKQSRKNKFWCPKCDKQRISYIDKKMKELGTKLGLIL